MIQAGEIPATLLNGDRHGLHAEHEIQARRKALRKARQGEESYAEEAGQKES